jgi:hypothetical protein
VRIIPFPQPAGSSDEPTLAEIEAALHGDAVGERAEQWRDLRADVRALAPPLPPGLEQRLREQIEERALVSSARSGASWRPPAVGARARGCLTGGRQRPLLAGVGIALVVAIVALVLVAPWSSRSGAAHRFVSAHAAVATAVSEAPASSSGGGAVDSSATPHSTSSPSAARGGAARQAAQPLSASAPAAARVQQRAASLTLASSPAEVQSLSDRVAQLAVREGGVVQSSQVHLESGTAGEANLHLSLPSAHLSTALASLAQLAPTRAESQSLQDISDVYEALKRKLSDAVAERRALLRALSRVSTQGQIESLHARLSLASGAITSDREAFESISRRGSNANVEVSVIGNAHAGGDGLSVSGGLHDAGDVLRVSLAVLLIALAVLVPLTILAVLAAFGLRAARRRLRERALS